MTPRLPLTARQQQVLDYLVSFTLNCGYPPTLREIGDFMGIRSTNGVNDHLKILESKGYIERGTLKSRTIRVIGEEPTPVWSREWPTRMGDWWYWPESWGGKMGSISPSRARVGSSGETICKDTFRPMALGDRDCTVWWMWADQPPAPPEVST